MKIYSRQDFLNYKIGLKNNFLGLTALSFIFQSRFIPPPPINKETEGRKEKAEPPDATPRLAERRAKRGAEQPFRSEVGL